MIMEAAEQLEGVAGRHWHELADKRIQCDVCPRFCKLNEGQRGLCFVRSRLRQEKEGSHRGESQSQSQTPNRS